MRFAFDDTEIAVASAVKNSLNRLTDAGALRALQREPAVRSSAWRVLADQGVFAMLIDEADGGMGLGWAAAVLVLHELGYSGIAGPYPDSVAVAPVLLQAADHPRCRELLQQLANGDVTVGVRFGDNDAVSFAQELDFVLDASTDELRILESPVRADDVVPSLDDGWPLHRVFSTPGIAIGKIASDARERAWDTGVLATAAMLLGTSARLLDMTRAYAATREQFGRPIGSFQAVQHQLVDAFLKTEFAAAPVHKAAWSMEGARPGAARDAAVAKRAASIAAHHAARTAVQLHGAIGYTWEYDLSIWVKREQTLTALYGNAAWHTRRLTSDLMEQARGGTAFHDDARDAITPGDATASGAA